MIYLVYSYSAALSMFTLVWQKPQVVESVQCEGLYHALAKNLCRCLILKWGSKPDIMDYLHVFTF